MNVSTFADYSQCVFNTCLKKELLTMVELILYRKSIKASALLIVHEKEGRKEFPMKVNGNVKVPHYFQNFLHDVQNKEEPFDFLTSNILSCSICANQVCYSKNIN